MVITDITLDKKVLIHSVKEAMKTRQSKALSFGWSNEIPYKIKDSVSTSLYSQMPDQFEEDVIDFFAIDRRVVSGSVLSILRRTGVIFNNLFPEHISPSMTFVMDLSTQDKEKSLILDKIFNPFESKNYSVRYGEPVYSMLASDLPIKWTPITITALNGQTLQQMLIDTQDIISVTFDQYRNFISLANIIINETNNQSLPVKSIHSQLPLGMASQEKEDIVMKYRRYFKFDEMGGENRKGLCSLRDYILDAFNIALLNKNSINLQVNPKFYTEVLYDELKPTDLL